MRAAGLKVVTHHGTFKDNARDDDWLRKAGRRKWVVITKDKNIRKRSLEREAIMTAKVRAFIFTGGDLSGVEMGEILVAAIPKMGRILDETKPPFVARVTGAGDVAVIDDESAADGT